MKLIKTDLRNQMGEDYLNNALISAMNKYPNIYTGMNFDTQTSDVRKPIDLPERLEVKLENNSHIKIPQEYTNCRPILSELLNGKVNVGMTNVTRNN